MGMFGFFSDPCLYVPLHSVCTLNHARVCMSACVSVCLSRVLALPLAHPLTSISLPCSPHTPAVLTLVVGKVVRMLRCGLGEVESWTQKRVLSLGTLTIKTLLDSSGGTCWGLRWMWCWVASRSHHSAVPT